MNWRIIYFLVLLIKHMQATNWAPSKLKANCGCSPEKVEAAAFNEAKHFNAMEAGVSPPEGEANVSPEPCSHHHREEDWKFRPQALTSSSSMHAAAKWPHGCVHYYLHHFSHKDAAFIASALSELSRKTNGSVSFQRVSRHFQGPFTTVTHTHMGCYSSWGLQKSNLVNLGKHCITKRHIQHEFLHTLGLHHEHVRPDRDTFVRINWANIQSHHCINFQKCNDCPTFGVAYDPHSIMHYSPTGFSCNGKKTIVSKRHATLGGRKLSKFDIQKIMRLYMHTGKA